MSPTPSTPVPKSKADRPDPDPTATPTYPQTSPNSQAVKEFPVTQQIPLPPLHAHAIAASSSGSGSDDSDHPKHKFQELFSEDVLRLGLTPDLVRMNAMYHRQLYARKYGKDLAQSASPTKSVNFDSSTLPSTSTSSQASARTNSRGRSRGGRGRGCFRGAGATRKQFGCHKDHVNSDHKRRPDAEALGVPPVKPANDYDGDSDPDGPWSIGGSHMGMMAMRMQSEEELLNDYTDSNGNSTLLAILSPLLNYFNSLSESDSGSELPDSSNIENGGNLSNSPLLPQGSQSFEEFIRENNSSPAFSMPSTSTNMLLSEMEKSPLGVGSSSQIIVDFDKIDNQNVNVPLRPAGRGKPQIHHLLKHTLNDKISDIEKIERGLGVKVEQHPHDFSGEGNGKGTEQNPIEIEETDDDESSKVEITIKTEIEKAQRMTLLQIKELVDKMNFMQKTHTSIVADVVELIRARECPHAFPEKSEFGIDFRFLEESTLIAIKQLLENEEKGTKL